MPVTNTLTYFRNQKITAVISFMIQAPRFSNLHLIVSSLFPFQYWYDYKLQWDPEEYGGVDMLHVPSDHIWCQCYQTYLSPLLMKML